MQINRKNKKISYIDFEDEAYSVGLSFNNNYNSRNFSYIFSSLKSPPAIYSQNLYTGKRKKFGVKKF